MKYIGQASKLQLGELAEIAHSFGLEEAHLKTVIAVETSGKGFNSAGWVEFLFEPHKFYQNVPKTRLAEAIKQGLAYPTWRGPGSYPKTLQLRIQQFQKAAAMDETAAIKSASWGLGQIMGTECVEAGYPTPQAMLEAFAESEGNQVRGMCSLIKHRGLDRDLHNFPDMAACRHFALRYNGKLYEKNNYHNKLHDAYVRFAGAQQIRGSLDPMEDGTLAFGEQDREKSGGPIWRAQEQLKALGYALRVDGNFGPGTRAAVLAWKANNDMDTSSKDLHPADLEFLKISPPMPVAAERENATVADLKPESSIIRESSSGKTILGWSTGITGAASLASESGILEHGQDALEKAQHATGILSSIKYTISGILGDTGISSIIKIIVEYRFLILVAVAIGGFIIMNRVQKKRLEMHQKAEIG